VPMDIDMGGNKSIGRILKHTEQIGCHNLVTKQVSCQVLATEQIGCFSDFLGLTEQIGRWHEIGRFYVKVKLLKSVCYKLVKASLTLQSDRSRAEPP